MRGPSTIVIMLGTRKVHGLGQYIACCVLGLWVSSELRCRLITISERVSLRDLKVPFRVLGVTVSVVEGPLRAGPVSSGKIWGSSRVVEVYRTIQMGVVRGIGNCSKLLRAGVFPDVELVGTAQYQIAF